MSLASLLQYRKQVEDQVKQDLARVAHALDEAERAQASLAQEQGLHESRYREATHAGLTVEDLVQWQSRFEALAAASEQAARTVVFWRAQWDETQGRLVEARQEREALDRLIARHQEEAAAAERRRDQMAMDDAAHYQASTKGARAA